MNVVGQAVAAAMLLVLAIPLLGDSHGCYLTSPVMLATEYGRAADANVAEGLYQQVIDTRSRLESHSRVFLAQVQTFLGIYLTNKGAYPDAETFLRQSEAIYREIYGGDTNYNVGTVKANLAWLYFLKGDYVRAEDEGRKALDLLRRYLGPEHIITANTAANFGLILTRDGKAAEGEPYLREALAIRQKIVSPDNFMIPYTESALGDCLVAQKRYAEAEPILIDSYLGLIWKLGETDARTVEARRRVAKLYDDWGKPDQALLFR